MVFGKFNMNTMQRRILALAVLCLTCFKGGQCVFGEEPIRMQERRILKDLLHENTYDRTMRPDGVNYTGPLIITVNMLVRNVENINDKEMTWTPQVTFRQQWVDSRLRYDDRYGQIAYLTLRETDRIWKPDTFFKNEREGHFHEMISPNVLVRIYPTGEVLYSIRLTLTLSCPMDLKYYPAERQICPIQLASYGYTTEHIEYRWKENYPIQVGLLNLPMWTWEKTLPDICTSKTNTGSYSCLQADFLFARDFSYYLYHIYMPTLLLVMVSWVAFWIDGRKEFLARLFLTLTTLLVLVGLVTYLNSSMPAVSYTKRIDIWTGFCVTFVFLALLETATVNYLLKNSNMTEETRKGYQLIKAMQSVPLDRLSRIVFPAAFLLFTLLYAISFLFDTYPSQFIDIIYYGYQTS